MASVTADPATTVQLTRLRQRLAALRLRLRLVASFRGGGWVVAVLVGTAVLAGLIDWRLHLPAVIRALFLVGGLAVAGALAYRYLLRPLGVRDDDLALALRIERHYPGLNDSLGSTVQFLEQPDDHASPAMRKEAVRRGLRGVEKCDFGRVVDRRGLVPANLLALLGAAAALTLFAWQPALANVAFLRLVDPFGGHDWPRETRLEIDAPRTRIGRNEAFEVSGRAFGVVPPTASVVFRLDGVTPTEHTCEIAAAEDGKSGSFHTRLEPGKVLRDFQFQVRAHDAATDWYPVTVLPPPLLVPLQGRASPLVRLRFPEYTDLPEVDLPDGSGNVEAVAGTVVTLRAAANRPLASAWIDFQPEARGAEAVLFLGPLAAPNAAGALSGLVAGGTVWGRVPALLEGDRRELTVMFRPTVSGTYALHFQDATGLHNSRLFELRVFPDPAPSVTLERPSPARDTLTVLPDATVTLQTLAEDPHFALRSVYLEYRCKKTDPPRRLTLFDHDEAARLLEKGRAVLTGGPAAAPPPRSRLQRLQVTRALALKEFRHLNPADGGLKDGDVLTLQVCADDFDDLSVDKQPGRSHEVEIRIVSRNALDLIVNQAQAKVREDLLKLRELERDAIKKVTEAQAHLKQTGKLTPEDANRLGEAENLQQQIRERVGTPQEGLRADVARILETLRENHLPRTAAEERMEAVDRELDRLAREELGQIEPRLTNARKQNERTDPKGDSPKERQAREQGRLAEEKEKAAAEAERDAKARPRGDPEKAQKQQKAAEARKQAEAERKKAEELRQEADKNPDGDPKADPNGSRQMLKEARQHQEEVEKTLNDMLARLEPWASTQEVKGEAKALLEEQRRLQQQSEEMQQKDLRGVKPEEQQEQKAALEKAQAEQGKLEERARQLFEKMDRLAQDRKEKDPQTSKELEGAAKQGRDSNVAGLMQEAREKLQQNQLGQAGDKQRESARQLENLVKTLEDRREAELDRLLKKLQQEQKALDALKDEQERLRKKVKEAEQIADPKKREEELKRLAREQERLEKKAEEMAKQLSRQREERGAQAMSQAAEQMREATRQMQQGQNGDENQEEALDRLQEAKEELERAKEDAEDELAREQLAKVADEIRRIKERQESLIAEAERIQRELLQKRPEEWRGLLISLGRLAEAQGVRDLGLGKELAGLAGKKLDGAPVFARVLRKTSEAMEQAAQRLLEHRDEAKDTGKAETTPGKEAARFQQDALKRLTQLLDTLKQAQAASQGGRPGGNQGQGGQGGGGGGGGGGDGIPPIAQLKLLRQMQVEVNQRTDEFRKQHPDPAKLDEKARTELQDIRREQQEIAELLEDFIQPGEPEGDKP